MECVQLNLIYYWEIGSIVEFLNLSDSSKLQDSWS